MRLGIGTWGGSFGAVDDPRKYPLDKRGLQRKKCVASLQYAFKKGVRIIDTAPSYGAGFAEECVGAALNGWNRDEFFIITKISGDVKSIKQMEKSVESSLHRLKVKRVDLLLLHWYPDRLALCEVMKGLEHIKSKGLCTSVGVSNFSLQQFKKAQERANVPLVANEVEYNMVRRDTGRYTKNVESEVLPYNKRHHILTIAYKVLMLGELITNERICVIAERLGLTSAQYVVNWVLDQGVDVVLFRSENEKHIDEIIACEKKTKKVK
jgi:diketogulonate reductase-like aldo/keto reductase